MSPITPKTNLTTPMLPLHAIPTEVIRKGFRPYRGFMTTVAINIPDEDAPLALLVDAPQGPLTGEKVALLALNVFPIYEVFAQLFGYDPKLLMVGNGDCGVEGQDWNLYGVKDRVPQVVRWRGFDGGEAEADEDGAERVEAGVDGGQVGDGHVVVCYESVFLFRSIRSPIWGRGRGGRDGRAGWVTFL